ncbi:MAG: hypothetical protein RL001_1345 [Pseudomonadota bacterium]
MRSTSLPPKVADIFEQMTRAAANKQPLEVDATGNVVAGQKLSVTDTAAARLKTLFINPRDNELRAAVMNKMVDEAIAILPQDREACEKLIQERVPGLGQLSYVSTAIGSDPSTMLTTQWQALQKELRAKLQGEVLSKRQEILDDMTRLLPPEMELMNIDGEVFRMRKPLSERAQANILEGFAQLEHDPISPSGIHEQTEKDLNRSSFRFIYREQPRSDDQPVRTRSIELPPGNRNQALEHLKDICGRDATTIATVSKLINQRALAPLMIAMQMDFSPRDKSEVPPMFAMETSTSTKKTENGISSRDKDDKVYLAYSVEQTGDGRLLIGAEIYSKGEIMSDASGQKNWPINRSSRWEGPPHPGNAASMGSYLLSANLSDLSQGVIRVSHVKPAEGGYQIEPALPPLPKIE